METLKVYLNEAGFAFVACRNCGKSREMSFAGKKIPPASLVKCSCSNTFIVTFEKRQHYRKALNTFGTCFVKDKPNEAIPVKIIDISDRGLQFEISEGARFQHNQNLRVVFRLDKKMVSLVVAVRHIRGDIFGAEILSMDPSSRKIIGFYLLP